MPAPFAFCKGKRQIVTKSSQDRLRRSRSSTPASVAKIYEAAIQQLRVPNWQANVTRKQQMLANTYQLLKAKPTLIARSCSKL